MSANALLERMRKLREERERAAQSGQVATTTSEASATTGKAIQPTTPLTSKTSETQGSAEDVLLHVPPSFMSPTNAQLRYRDTIHDPLCVRCTSEAVVELLQHFLSDRTAVEVGNDEVSEGERPAKRARNESTNTSNSSTTRSSPERSAQQVVVDYFARQMQRTTEMKVNKSDGEAILVGATPQTLYEDRAYWSAVAAAHVAVNGAVRPMCRDVNHYIRRSRLAHGVYGVVFSATAAPNKDSPLQVNHKDDDTKKKEEKKVSSSAEPELFALKQIKKQWLEESQVGFPPYLLREFDLLLRLRHPNIVEAKELVLLDPIPLPGQESTKDQRESSSEKKKKEKEEDAKEEDKKESDTEAATQDTKQAVDAPKLNNTNNGSTSKKTNVLAAVGMTSKAKDVFLVMEYCCYDLKNYLFRYTRDGQKPFLHLSSRNAHPAARDNLLARIKCIFYQLLRGLAFLHDHRILHRDLKTSNILLSAEGRVKIADFGLGRLYREGQTLTPTVVTLMYRAPELHFGLTDYSHAMDVWSAGCIFAELFLKQPLFRASSETAHLQAVCDLLGIPTEESFPGLYKLPLTKDAMRGLSRWNRRGQLAEMFTRASCPDAALLPASGLDLLQRMLRWNPLDRISATDALTHVFFTEEPLPCAPAELMRPMPFMPRDVKPITTTTAAPVVVNAIQATSTTTTTGNEQTTTATTTVSVMDARSELSQPGMMSSPAAHYVSPTLHPTRRTASAKIVPHAQLPSTAMDVTMSSPVQLAALQAANANRDEEDNDASANVPADEDESEAEGVRVAQQALLRANQDLEDE